MNKDNEILNILQSCEIKTGDEVPPPQVCLSIEQNGQKYTIGTLGNFSLRLGKAKSRKTFYIASEMASLISGMRINSTLGVLPDDKKTVLFFDNEQGLYHANRTRKAACKLAEVPNPENFRVFRLRQYSVEERLQYIEWAIYNLPNIGVVFIDGIRDLIRSINDESEATMITHKLLKWTEEQNIHIVCLLHMNKNDKNARGHVGTEILNKAESIISISKDTENKNISVVECELSREKDFEPFAFEINELEVPVIIESWSKSPDKKERAVTPLTIAHETHLIIVKQVFSLKSNPTYGELVRLIKIAMEKVGKSIGDNKAKDFITYYQEERYLKKIGEGRKAYYEVIKYAV